MTNLAEKIWNAINAKELKAHEASTHSYDEAGVMEMDPGSMEWRVVTRNGYTWLSDQDDAVALAADVDLTTETWDPIPRGRLEFIADNDPASVRLRCAADRELIERFRNLCANYKHLKSLDYLLDEQVQQLRTTEALIAEFAAVTLPALARGYGIEVGS